MKIKTVSIFAQMKIFHFWALKNEPKFSPRSLFKQSRTKARRLCLLQDTVYYLRKLKFVKMRSKITLEHLNALTVKEFHNIFENVVECHPEAAKYCSTKLPFDSVDAMIATFDNYLQQLSVENKTRVLRSFPDLAGKLLDSHQLTEESTFEHACAGLDKLMAEDRDQLTTLNRKYQDKFGFPFVICAREASRFEAILNGITTRIHNQPEQELETGIGEAKKICKLRILQLVEQN